MIWSYFLYLAYGLAFFTLGVAILSRDTSISELGIARILWLLAAFGIIHGLHEWLEFVTYLAVDQHGTYSAVIRLLIVSLSFLFLLYFGIFIIIITVKGDSALEITPPAIKAVVGFVALSVIVYSVYLDLKSGTDINVRHFVAFPGGLLSGVGLMMYSRVVKPFSNRVAVNFVLGGASMVGYSFFTGIIPSEVIIPILNVPVILLRGVSAFLTMLFIIRALSVFNLEQKKLVNEQLLRFSESEKLTSMGMLAAGIAHEINNPLANASLNIEMLRDRLNKDSDTEKKLAAIERNVDRAAKIARELLHFSHESETEMVSTDLNKRLMSSINLLKNQKKSSIIQLNLNDIPRVQAIPWKIEEVFINILLNSFDATSSSDRIDVTSYHHDGYAVIRISDTGQGISQENLTKVFDPFYTTKAVGKGTGLGLSVCYNIVKHHGGKISITNNQDRGTTTTIKFPLSE